MAAEYLEIVTNLSVYTSILVGFCFLPIANLKEENNSINDNGVFFSVGWNNHIDGVLVEIVVYHSLIGGVAVFPGGDARVVDIQSAEQNLLVLEYIRSGIGDLDLATQLGFPGGLEMVGDFAGQQIGTEVHQV